MKSHHCRHTGGHIAHKRVDLNPVVAETVYDGMAVAASSPPAVRRDIPLKIFANVDSDSRITLH
jgi:hypothetical protein